MMPPEEQPTLSQQWTEANNRFAQRFKARPNHYFGRNRAREATKAKRKKLRQRKNRQFEAKRNNS